MKFDTLVKKLLSFLPKDDYPVLNSQLFFSIWLEFILDQSVTSMRELFARLKFSQKAPDISTFSKANINRKTEYIINIYQYLNKLAKQKKPNNSLNRVPIDATVITLTSKLMWSLDYHQVKLFAGSNLSENNLTNAEIVFGQSHDCNYGEELIKQLKKNDIAIMDRGFASQKLINYCCQNSQYFVVRINRNYQLFLDEENGYLRCFNQDIDCRCRVVNFCDLEKRTEYRIATNLPFNGEGAIENRPLA